MNSGVSWLSKLSPEFTKLIFDIGSGSMANLASYIIPYEYLDKVFLSHLHTDHMGDLDSRWPGVLAVPFILPDKPLARS